MPIKLKTPPSKKYWDVENSTDSQGNPTGELYLYGLITDEKWWEDDVTPKGLVNDINALGAISELNVHLFSNGGDVFSGNAIYSILKQRKETVNVYVEGIAASIATVIAMAADNLYIDKNAMFMIHNPMLMLFGMYNTIDMGKMIADLNRVRDVTIRAYTDRTGLTDEQVYALLDANDGEGTWFNAEEAVAAGFCDAITPDAKAPEEMAAMIRPDVYKCRGHEIDMSIYKRAPKLAAAASRAKTGGKQMPKRMSQKARPKMEALKLTCPHCQTLLDFDTSTLIVSPDPTEDATVATPQDKSTATYKNELYTIACPSCGGEFEIDTEPDAESTPMSPPGGDPVPQAKKKPRVTASRRSKPKAVTVRPVKMTETVQITCTECGTEFALDIDPSIETAEVECPGCGATLTVDTSNVGGDTGEDTGGIDEPDAGIVAYKNGTHSERQRLMTLDERARAFPQFADAIEQFKKNGTSVECANNWIFRALAANPQQAGHPAQIAAARRDAAPLNRLGNPARVNDNTAKAHDDFVALAKRRGTQKNA